MFKSGCLFSLLGSVLRSSASFPFPFFLGGGRMTLASPYMTLAYEPVLWSNLFSTSFFFLSSEVISVVVFWDLNYACW